jgi:CubicO group peptidase (beta-lactamase class C family)
VQSIIDARSKQLGGIGIVVGLVDGKRTTFFRAGTSGTKRPLDARTLFEIGSVTKTFTGTLLALSVLDKSVRPEEPVADLLPPGTHVPSKGDAKIELIDLATQFSGLPRLPANLPTDTKDPYASYTADDLFHFLSDYVLPRPPGAAFEYSNLGAGLLGYALAHHAKTTYEALVTRSIFKPLHMDDSFVDVPADRAEGVATPHDADGNVTNAWHFNALAGAGAIRSSAADMVKYLRANLGEGPLSAACALALKPVRDLPDERIGYFWMTSAKYRMIWHNGGTGGYRSFVGVDPAKKRGVVVLSNSGVGVDDIGFHVLNAAYPLEDYPDSSVDTKALEQYAGTYDFGQGLKLAIVREGRTLRARLGGQPAYRIYADGKDAFVYRVVEASLTFGRNAAGKIVNLTLHQSGRDLPATKE